MSRPQWIPGLAAESVAVVLSILLALAADAWWEGRETQTAVEVSLTSIQAEIARTGRGSGRWLPHRRECLNSTVRENGVEPGVTLRR